MHSNYIVKVKINKIVKITLALTIDIELGSEYIKVASKDLGMPRSAYDWKMVNRKKANSLNKQQLGVFSELV